MLGGKVPEKLEHDFVMLNVNVEAVLQVALLTGLRNASGDQSQPVSSFILI